MCMGVFVANDNGCVGCVWRGGAFHEKTGVRLNSMQGNAVDRITTLAEKGRQQNEDVSSSRVDLLDVHSRGL